MVVAVAADAPAGQPSADERVEAFLDILVPSQDRFRQRTMTLGEVLELLTQQVERFVGRVPQRLIQRPLIELGEVLRGETRLRRRVGQRQMKLRRAQAQKLGGLQGIAQTLERERRRRRAGRSEKPGGGSRQLLGEFRRRLDVVEITAQGVERVLPGVSFVRNEAMQDREQARLAPARTIGDLAGESRRRVEAPLLEESPDLRVGILTFMVPAVQLQDQAVAEADGGVPLDGLRRRRFGLGLSADHGLQRRRGAQDDLAMASFEPAAFPDPGQEGPAELRVRHRVEEDALGASSRAFAADRGQNREGLLLQDLRGLLAVGEGDRKHVGLGRRVQEIRLDEADAGAGLVRGVDDRVLDQADRAQLVGLPFEPETAAEMGLQGLDELRVRLLGEKLRPGIRASDRRRRRRGRGGVDARDGGLADPEPVEGMGAEGEAVRLVLHGRELVAAEHLDEAQALEPRQV